MVFAVIYLPVDPWVRAFLGLGILFLTTSAFTLAKCVRDAQENQAVSRASTRPASKDPRRPRPVPQRQLRRLVHPVPPTVRGTAPPSDAGRRPGHRKDEPCPARTPLGKIKGVADVAVSTVVTTAVGTATSAIGAVGAVASKVPVPGRSKALAPL